jgi:hypothetical protein
MQKSQTIFTLCALVFLSINYSNQSTGKSVALGIGVSDRWHVTGEMLQKTFDMWLVAQDM